MHTFEKIKVLLFLLINNMTFLYCYTLENWGYMTKRVDGLIPFNKRSVIIM